MKTWKQNAFFSLAAVIAIGFAFVGCGDKTDPCNCDPKAHLGIGEKCGCGGSGCNCTEQTASMDGVPIRKSAGITVQQMNTAVEKINTVYSGSDYGLRDEERDVIKSKVTEIHIILGKNLNLTGKILEIGYESDEMDILDCFIDDLVYP